MHVKKIIELVTTAVLIPFFYLTLSVTPADSGKNAGAWWGFLVERLPTVDAGVIRGTLWVELATVVCYGLWTASQVSRLLWWHARQRGVFLIRPAKRPDEPMTPLEALFQTADPRAVQEHKARQRRLLEAQAEVGLLERDVRQAEREERRQAGRGAVDPSHRLQDARAKLQIAREDVESQWEWLDIFLLPLRGALVEKLQRGVLRASAFPTAALMEGSGLFIQTQQWTFLELDFKNDTASSDAHGVTYYHVRIHRSPRRH